MAGENIKSRSIQQGVMVSSGPSEPTELLEYLASLQQRIGALERNISQLIAKEHEREERLQVARGTLRREIAEFGDDIHDVESRLFAVIQETRSLVTAFKSAVRQHDFQRIKQRVDGWRGETFILREELKRIALEEARRA